MKRPLAAGLLLLALALPPSVRAQEEPAEIVVFAAASLKEAFDQLARRFEAEHAGISVRLNLAGSQDLRVQIENGAPADVFASADLRHMAALEKAGLAGRSSIFARNHLAIIVPQKNPAGLARLEDLPKAKRLVLGAIEVPVGEYTRQMLAKASHRFGFQFGSDVESHVVSRELNVRQVLAKVMLGEADAGVVYATDAASARDRVKTIPIPADLNVVAEYPIATLGNARRGELAEAWVAFVLSPAGEQILRSAGFRPAGGEERGE